MSIRPTSPDAAGPAPAGQPGRPKTDAPAPPTFRRPVRQRSGRPAQRLGALAAAAAVAIAALVHAPAVSAEIQAGAAASGIVRQAAPQRGEGTPRDAFDGGFFPAGRQFIVPSIELGLTQERAIPVGVTCACTIDRTGLVSRFDLTVIEVVQDAYPMVQQLNRFNRPPRPGARYVAAYVGQQYIAGPENQAYTVSDADWKATATDQRLSDTAQLLHQEPEFRPRADVFPQNYVNGWLIYELPINRPAYLVWNFNFVGERGVWFALQ